MKSIIAVFATVLLIIYGFVAIAQTNESLSLHNTSAILFPKTATSKKTYTLFTWNAGALFVPSAHGAFNVKVPYISKLSTGINFNNRFEGGLKNAWHTPLIVTDALGLQHVWGNQLYDVRLGFIPSNGGTKNSGGAYISAGYGHVFHWNFNHNQQKGLLIKPILNVSFSQVNKYVGTIDNINKRVNILGCTADSIFTKHAGNGKRLYHAKDLTVDFVQNTLAIVPEISISNQTNHRIYWSFNTGWYIPIATSSGLTLTQTDGAKYHNVAGGGLGLRPVRLHHPDINADLNGNSVHNSPFSFKGLYTGLSVGFYLSRPKG